MLGSHMICNDAHGNKRLSVCWHFLSHPLVFDCKPRKTLRPWC